MAKKQKTYDVVISLVRSLHDFISHANHNRIPSVADWWIYHKRNTKTQLSLEKMCYIQPIQFLLQYWPSRSSKVDDFYLISKAYMPHSVSD